MIYNTFIDNMLLHIYYYIMTESPDAHLRSQTFYLVHLGYQYNMLHTQSSRTKSHGLQPVMHATRKLLPKLSLMRVVQIA